MFNSSYLLADAIPTLDGIMDFDPSGVQEFVRPDTVASAGGIFEHWFFTNAIPAWISYGISLSVAVAILLIVVAGIYLMMSPEVDEMKQKAIDTITWSIVGLLTIMLSYTIIEIVSNIQFSSGTNPNINVSVENQTELDKLVTGDLRSELIPEFIQTLLKLMGTFALLLFIYAGAILVLRDGDEEKVTKAKDILIYAIIGAVVSLLAYLIIEAVIQFNLS